jgi:hypothetical protein
MQLHCFIASLQTHKVGGDTTSEDISNGSCTVLEVSTRLSDEMQLLPENLPFYCCNMCLVVFKTYKEFEVHICKNGGNSLEGETTLVSSSLFYDELIHALTIITAVNMVFLSEGS